MKHVMEMQIEVKEIKKVNVTHLQVFAVPARWENAKVNGVEDEDGDLIPFRFEDEWRPIINVDTGMIEGWPKDTTAEIHYKIRDEGSYFLLDESGSRVLSRENDFVPSCLCPKKKGYGDYIIMDVEANGRIKNWKPDFASFAESEDD